MHMTKRAFYWAAIALLVASAALQAVVNAGYCCWCLPCLRIYGTDTL